MSFWQGKSVLVTGANGFIGSHLIHFLAQKDAHVVGLTLRKPSVQKKGTEKIQWTECDINDFDALLRIIKENKTKVIYHLAAQPLVKIGTESPLPTFNTNIRGTWNILEAARQLEVDNMIIASTTHVYGKNTKLPYKEEYFPQPSRPYETSKACADLLGQCFADTYGLTVAIPRFANIYGPGDMNPTRLIPVIMKEVTEGRNPRIWDVGAVRDFLYIDDAIGGYLKLAEKRLPNKSNSRIFNFGTGKPVKIERIVKKILSLHGNRDIVIEKTAVPKERHEEVIKQYVSVEKAKEILNWEPKVDLDEGLRRTYEWYKANMLNEK